MYSPGVATPSGPHSFRNSAHSLDLEQYNLQLKRQSFTVHFTGPRIITLAILVLQNSGGCSKKLIDTIPEEKKRKI